MASDANTDNRSGTARTRAHAVDGPSASMRTNTRTATSSNGAFNHFKNWRGLASRYDKYALVYRGGVVLAAIVLWLS
jgi:transposase